MILCGEDWEVKRKANMRAKRDYKRQPDRACGGAEDSRMEPVVYPRKSRLSRA